MNPRNVIGAALARSRRATAMLVDDGAGTYLDNRPCFLLNELKGMKKAKNLLEYQQFHLDHCEECRKVFHALPKPE